MNADTIYGDSKRLLNLHRTKLKILLCEEINMKSQVQRNFYFFTSKYKRVPFSVNTYNVL